MKTEDVQSALSSSGLAIRKRKRERARKKKKRRRRLVERVGDDLDSDGGQEKVEGGGEWKTVYFVSSATF